MKDNKLWLAAIEESVELLSGIASDAQKAATDLYSGYTGDARCSIDSIRCLASSLHAEMEKVQRVKDLVS